MRKNACNVRLEFGENGSLRISFSLVLPRVSHQTPIASSTTIHPNSPALPLRGSISPVSAPSLSPYNPHTHTNNGDDGDEGKRPLNGPAAAIAKGKSELTVWKPVDDACRPIPNPHSKSRTATASPNWFSTTSTLHDLVPSAGILISAKSNY